MDVIDNFVNFQGKNNKIEKHILVTHNQSWLVRAPLSYEVTILLTTLFFTGRLSASGD